MNIAIAGTGYAGISLAVLLSRFNDVTGAGIAPKKIDAINSWKLQN